MTLDELTEIVGRQAVEIDVLKDRVMHLESCAGMATFSNREAFEESVRQIVLQALQKDDAVISAVDSRVLLLAQLR